MALPRCLSTGASLGIRLGNGSRVNREVYARFCERLRVKFHGPTHQLRLLDLEPAVSSGEITAEIERGPLPESAESDKATDKQRRSRQNHPGRNELPASL